MLQPCDLTYKKTKEFMVSVFMLLASAAPLVGFPGLALLQVLESSKRSPTLIFLLMYFIEIRSENPCGEGKWEMQRYEIFQRVGGQTNGALGGLL